MPVHGCETAQSDASNRGGGGGIRTPETLSSLTVFKTAGFNRSPTPPPIILTHSGIQRGDSGSGRQIPGCKESSKRHLQAEIPAARNRRYRHSIGPVE